jgi:predicted transcriptional regulator
VVEKLYSGSLGLFVQSFLDGGSITPAEKEKLRQLIDRYDSEENA